MEKWPSPSLGASQLQTSAVRECWHRKYGAQRGKEASARTAQQGCCIAQPRGVYKTFNISVQICFTTGVSLVQFALSHFTSEVRKNKSRPFELQKQVHTQVSSNQTNPTKIHPFGPFGFLLQQAPCLVSQKTKINSRSWLAQAYQNIYKCIYGNLHAAAHAAGWAEAAVRVSGQPSLVPRHCPWFCSLSPQQGMPGAWQQHRQSSCCTSPGGFTAAILPGEGMVNACWEASHQCILKAISWHLTRNTNPTQFSLWCSCFHALPAGSQRKGFSHTC